MTSITPINYYQQQLFRITEHHFPLEHQVAQVVSAKQFIEQHASSDINLDTIAGNAFFSKYHFIRIFKRCYGRTPYQYLIEVRLQKAKQLLQSGLSVSDTCVSVGFTSPTSFASLFKKITGLTPGAYSQKSNFR